ncbi:lysine N(6)-hydroxylase/L-ornithine N(5)-oxygenase family protein [Salisediminibacterium halotolerans]|uniref:lysine N(6)-hydroxylase/L-ornithine N(5)-oxygenase family protein n=1 Tax=Salisediminibacterium halotolerans TaxID=517425 RepID=UPI000EADBBD0|nr:SidA/IucD/PvdA family monooxygenase [Salisediminibacterium halotolerans]RLJ69259.1 lysine N6-hydroxylase [Actinophytocola xinjiangensis]RPE87006.1 lysine N6-hydroxylase [Salisediminibacterium halotolerans]TWG32261.1 lysine N6-hydroxylase [Salisediminibacterium halotolerans]GEL08000.1 lysine 6-monooxygenase [Salisediminibacterium halotolerans]
MNQRRYDLIGIGIGPFHLGMAALTEEVGDIDALFLDEDEEFQWHPGMLLEGADLQVPFLADLVTFADPTNRFSFLNYLHQHNRLYQFYFFNRFDIPRREYNDYAQWVAHQLYSCQFARRVIDVIDHDNEDDPFYEVVTEHPKTKAQTVYYAKHVSLGTGSKPAVPEGLRHLPENDVIHSSRFLDSKETILNSGHAVVLGSGQSAAELFLELLQNQRYTQPHISWLTRSSGFFQLEAGKIGLEFFSPDFVDYFYQLPYEKRMDEIPLLTRLRNGVEEQTLHKIYDLLYHRSVENGEPNVTIQGHTEALKAEKLENGRYRLHCREWQEEETFSTDADKIILSTGYKPHIPDWFTKFADKIEWEDDANYKVTRDYQLVFKTARPHRFFTLTDLLHSHGIGATNLALSVQRNVTIINTIAGRTVYPEQRNTVFQQFGVKNKPE